MSRLQRQLNKKRPIAPSSDARSPYYRSCSYLYKTFEDLIEDPSYSEILQRGAKD